VAVDWSSAGGRLVGARVQHWWDGDASWFSGRVLKYSAATQQHLMQYDVDGEEEWLKVEDEPLLYSEQVAWAQVKGHSLWPCIQWSWTLPAIGAGGFTLPAGVQKAQEAHSASAAANAGVVTKKKNGSGGSSSGGGKKAVSGGQRYCMFFGNDDIAWCSDSSVYPWASEASIVVKRRAAAANHNAANSSAAAANTPVGKLARAVDLASAEADAASRCRATEMAAERKLVSV